MFWVIVAVVAGVVVVGAALVIKYVFSHRPTSINTHNYGELTPLVVSEGSYVSASNNRVSSLIAQRNIVTRQITEEATKAKIELAQFYEMSTSVQKREPKKAFDTYLELAKSGVDEILPSLERLGEELSATEQSKLSDLYKFFKNENKAKYWQSKANEVASFQF